MKWTDTTASMCRYAEVAARIFGDAEIIWEDSVRDYQGEVCLLARLPDGRYVHYAYDYGSCSGCDEWEDRDFSDDQIEAEMRREMAVLPNGRCLARYLHLDGKLWVEEWSGAMHASGSFKAMRQAIVAR